MEIGPVILAPSADHWLLFRSVERVLVEYAMRQLMINSHGNTVILKEFAMEMLRIN